MSNIDHGKGKIRDNHQHALVRSPVFKHKVEESKKSYNRKKKHKHKHLDS